MNTPHIHKDLIIAWANGAEIEYYRAGLGWEACRRPVWHAECTYRIKPKVVKARAWKGVGNPRVYLVQSTETAIVSSVERDIARGNTLWVSDWFDIQLTE